ncbi:FIG00471008: hypothetical protein [hydrothermal vent metagenome]|uniref:HDOD domain-containing protein n=1 Tax=hydrothermal vent metagenome TaxID=652676 RepID=A0A1W1D524_9ZZZZ
MITKDDINSYIDKIPPLPKTLTQTLALLNEGELIKAAQIAKEDMAFRNYLKNLLNKPIYGFTHEINDINQIFAILGVNGSQQSVYNYMIHLLSPDKWIVFQLNKTLFQTLQAELSINWKKILTHLQINNKNIESTITLIPASIIVTEAIFAQKIDDVTLLRTTKDIDFNTILQRLCHMDLFDIIEQIRNKWDLPLEIGAIIQAASGIKPSKDSHINMLGKWIHLLLFYTLSKPLFVHANLNDFIDFNPDYVADIYEDFITLMEIQ